MQKYVEDGEQRSIAAAQSTAHPSMKVLYRLGLTCKARMGSPIHVLKFRYGWLLKELM